MSQVRLKDWFLGVDRGADGDNKVPRILLLDGGVSTHLETSVTFPYPELWSSGLLLTNSRIIFKGHRDWIEAGCNVISTVTYQCHYEESLWPKIVTEHIMNGMWKDGISLAKQATQMKCPRQPVFVLASSGCYGAALANGAEYTGDYGKDMSMEKLCDFHARKIRAAVQHQPDGIAIETVPSILECRALAEVLSNFDWGDMACYVSLACRNENELNDGTILQDALNVLQSIPTNQLHGIGLNCCSVEHLRILTHSLVVDMAKRDTVRGIALYPNSGESYDAEKKEFVPGTESTTATAATMEDSIFEIVEDVKDTWLTHCPDRPLPSILVGGCCRTTPTTIQALSVLIDEHLAKDADDEELKDTRAYL